MEVIKDILFYMAVISGSLGLITLLICGVIKGICLLLDHLKVANTLREALALYIKTKNQDRRIEEKDIKVKEE